MSKQKSISKIKIIELVTVIFAIVISMFLLAGCQSTDISQSYFRTDELKYDCTYYEKTNQTEVKWSASIENGTIYNIKEIKIKFVLYNSDEIVKDYIYNFDLKILPGKVLNSTYLFTVDGKITDIKFVSWQAEYDSFWNVYKIWLIVMIILAIIGAIVYIIFMVVEDFDFDIWGDVCEFFSENIWMIVIVALPVIGGIIAVIMSYWVPVLIVLGGIIASILIMLLAQLIKYIVDNSTFIGFTSRADMEYAMYIQDIKKIKNEDTLANYTVEELREYCRLYDIQGYSKLNKKQLVELVLNANKYRNQKQENIIEQDERAPQMHNCKNCGAQLNIKKAKRGIVVCEFCHTEFEIGNTVKKHRKSR